VALFADSYYETNGVARTIGALETCAARSGVPLLSIHAGPKTRLVEQGAGQRLELRRTRPTSFPLEHDLSFDFAMWRHAPRVARVLRQFAPDVIHFTGPSDIGQLGIRLGRYLNLPMVGSWHTNLHEYVTRRPPFRWLPEAAGTPVRRCAERVVLRWTLHFYKMTRVVMAPNDDLLSLLARRTGKPTFLMKRGVDTAMFTPEKRRRADATVNIGYVGRLSPEKNVRLLAALEQTLRAEGQSGVRFTIVGEGKERQWLRQNMISAEFTGVLKGDALAGAYANMDLFAFPSETETVGNVVLEAMASGVPVVAMARGGPKFIATDGQTALLAESEQAFVDAVRQLVLDEGRRERMAIAARAGALELSWDEIFSHVCRAYQEAIAIAAAERRGVCVPEMLPASRRRTRSLAQGAAAE
jgi:glycosyltransferase involved in cell wall biosynthesis